nr:LPXTG cell wall anchor domain-containing protein [Enterococcus hulanensis]
MTSTKNQVTNVQVTASYPKTGDYQSQYLIFSGICLILLLFVLKKRKTTE